MRITPTTFTIADIRDGLQRDLRINHEYQRSNEVWPASAKSYFIDTILSGFPFPKIYIYAHYDADDNMRQLREIVDGQQRVTTMMEFLADRFYISTPNSVYYRRRFSELSPDIQQQYVATPVEADLILQAEPGEVLEMFRRINAYMAPLKPAERRHAKYNGRFKWLMIELADRFSPLLAGYKILTPKEIVRMGDAEFMTELVQVLDVGIVDKSPTKLEAIYKKYDTEFGPESAYRERVIEFFELLSTTLKPLVGTGLMKSYQVYSLFCATMGRKYGFPGSDDLGIPVHNAFYRSKRAALTTLAALATSLADDDEEGPFARYVVASSGQTTRKATRIPRATLLAEYLDA